MHSLLRAYATSITTAEADRALTRLLDYYVAATAAAMDTLFPAERKYGPRGTRPATPLPDVAGVAAARAWLDAEQAVLIRVADAVAARAGLDAPGPGPLLATGSRQVSTV